MRVVIRVSLLIGSWLIPFSAVHAGDQGTGKRYSIAENCQTAEACLEAIKAIATELGMESGETPSSALAGVWEGRVGDQPIRACFNKAFGGAYFYLENKQAVTVAIQLLPDSRNKFSELDSGRPEWIFDEINDTAISGRRVQGVFTLPLRLSRLAGLKADDESCGSLLFNQPRFPPTTITSSREIKDGQPLLKLAFKPASFPEVQIETFALESASPSIQRVNATLSKTLPGEPATSQWFDCVRAQLDATASDGKFFKTVKPTIITPKWLFVMDEEYGWCGASPYEQNIPRTFNLQTGDEVDLYDWLNSEAVVRKLHEGGSEMKTLAPALLKRVLENWKPDRGLECREAVEQANEWNIGLTRAGLVFTPRLAGVVRVCGEQFTMSYSRSAPFLTDKGKVGVASLRTAMSNQH